MRNRRGCLAGLSFACLLTATAQASADESWTLGPNGEWSSTQVPTPALAPPSAAPAPAAPPSSSSAGERPQDDGLLVPRAPGERERRSPAAMAGGIVLVSVSGLATLYGGVVAIGYKGYETGGFSDEERVTGYTLLGLGLAGTAGGIAMIAWGAQKEPTSTKVWAGPGRVGMSGTF